MHIDANTLVEVVVQLTENELVLRLEIGSWNLTSLFLHIIFKPCGLLPVSESPNANVQQKLNVSKFGPGAEHHGLPKKGLLRAACADQLGVDAHSEKQQRPGKQRLVVDPSCRLLNMFSFACWYEILIHANSAFALNQDLLWLFDLHIEGLLDKLVKVHSGFVRYIACQLGSNARAWPDAGSLLFTSCQIAGIQT